MSDHIKITIVLPEEWGKDAIALLDSMSDIGQSRHDKWLAQRLADAFAESYQAQGIPLERNRGIDRYFR